MAKVPNGKAVLKAIDKWGNRYDKKFSKGIKRAGLFLLTLSQKIVPVEFGPLRASGYVRAEGTGLNTVVYVGYTAEYAIIVHEDLELRHGRVYNEWYAEEIAAGYKTSRGPEQQAMFLSQPYRQNRRDMVDIIREELVK